MAVGENLTSKLDFIQFSVRPALVADLGAMAGVHEKAAAARDGLSLPDALGGIEARVAHEGSWAFVAETETDGEVNGFIIGHPAHHEGTIESLPHDDYLSLLMTGPALWGHGIGRNLLNRAVDHCRVNGKEHLWLWTASSNFRARGFYERYGFVRVGKQRIQQRQGVMELYCFDLSSPAP
jgi:ribosomal protein S18 acetylase RimI-like enzyme